MPGSHQRVHDGTRQLHQFHRVRHAFRSLGRHIHVPAFRDSATPCGRKAKHASASTTNAVRMPTFNIPTTVIETSCKAQAPLQAPSPTGTNFHSSPHHQCDHVHKNPSHKTMCGLPLSQPLLPACHFTDVASPCPRPHTMEGQYTVTPHACIRPSYVFHTLRSPPHAQKSSSKLKLRTSPRRPCITPARRGRHPQQSNQHNVPCRAMLQHNVHTDSHHHHHHHPRIHRLGHVPPHPPTTPCLHSPLYW